MTFIRNVKGTSDSDCKCGSWLKHWENFSGQRIPPFCPVFGCYEKELVGAHVQLANSTDQMWYLIPLCAEHNSAEGILSVSDFVNLVPANKDENSEKSIWFG